MKLFERNRNLSAFTLIEMLVVIAIIALLAALIVPGVASARRKADSITCCSNLRQMATAVNTYSVDHEDALPPGPSSSTSPLYLRRSHRASYTTDTKVDGAPSQQIAYHTAAYLGLSRPDSTVRFCPMMRCPAAWKKADPATQTQVNFVNYCVGRGASIGYPPFGDSTTRLPILISDAVDRPGVSSLGSPLSGSPIGPSKLWMLTDSDKQDDPGHVPQADLLDNPAHLDRRNIVYFDNHVSTIPVSTLTVDSPTYGL